MILAFTGFKGFKLLFSIADIDLDENAFALFYLVLSINYFSKKAVKIVFNT